MVPEAIVEQWEDYAESLGALLGEALVGLYIVGSAGRGDPNPGDIDCVAVVATPLSPDAVQVLHILHADPPRDWPRSVDTYVFEEATSRGDGDAEMHSFGWRGYVGETRPFDALLRNELVHASIRVLGPLADSLVAPPTADDVRHAVLEVVERHWRVWERHPDWLSNAYNAAFAVATVARGLVTLDSGNSLVSKSDALDWLNANAPEWSDLIEDARQVHQGVIGEEVTQARGRRLQMFLGDMIARAASSRASEDALSPDRYNRAGGNDD